MNREEHPRQVNVGDLQVGDVIDFNGQQIRIAAVDHDWSPDQSHVRHEDGFDHYPNKSWTVTVVGNDWSPPGSPPAAVLPASETAKPRRWHRRILTGLALAAAFVLGVGLGMTPTETTTTAATPEPATVTVTPEPEVITETETKTVTKRVVPQSCIRALKKAEAYADANSDAWFVAGDAMTAASTFDTEAINQATADLDRIRTEQIDPAVAEYVVAAEQCRAER